MSAGMSRARVLVVGALARGVDDLAWLVPKLTTINSKNGPFSCILLTSALSGATSAAIADVPPFPVATYFASTSFNASDVRAEVPDKNLTYVGPVGHERVLLAPSTDRANLAVSIVMVSDGYRSAPDTTDDPGRVDDEVSAAMTKAVYRSASFLGVDVLVTGAMVSSPVVAVMGEKLRPRFHFIGDDRAVECRETSFTVPQSTHGTHMVALARAVERTRAKWVYAAAIAPLGSLTGEELQASLAAGPCPYTREKPPPQKRRRIEHPRLDPQANCWFCLENEKDEHLVTNVGSLVFLALAKGGVVPQHVLILPIAHVRSTLDADLQCAMEIQKFKLSVRKYFDKELKSDTVFYERCLRTSGGELHDHGHLHAIPVPRGRSEKLAQIVKRRASVAGLTLAILDKDESIVDAVTSANGSADEARFFSIEHSRGFRALQILSESDRHPLEFGRQVVAELLGKSDRSHWRDCIESQEIETTYAGAFRSQFARYEPGI